MNDEKDAKGNLKRKGVKKKRRKRNKNKYVQKKWSTAQKGILGRAKSERGTIAPEHFTIQSTIPSLNEREWYLLDSSMGRKFVDLTILLPTTWDNVTVDEVTDRDEKGRRRSPEMLEALVQAREKIIAESRKVRVSVVFADSLEEVKKETEKRSFIIFPSGSGDGVGNMYTKDLTQLKIRCSLSESCTSLNYNGSSFRIKVWWPNKMHLGTIYTKAFKTRRQRRAVITSPLVSKVPRPMTPAELAELEDISASRERVFREWLAKKNAGFIK